MKLFVGAVVLTYIIYLVGVTVVVLRKTAEMSKTIETHRHK